MKRGISRLFLFQLISAVLLVALFSALRQECLRSEVAGIACLESAGTPIRAMVQFISNLINKVTVQAYFDYSIEVAWGVLGIITAALVVVRGLRLWSLFYLITIALALCGELEALKHHPQMVLWFHLAALSSAFASFLVLVIRDRGTLTDQWVAPGRHHISPRSLEILGVAGVFAILAVTRFYALNRLPGLWDAEACPHRPIAASWSRIIEQELGAHVQQSSGMLWVVLHNLFTRVNDPLLFLLDERLLGVGISFVNCWVVYFLVRFLRGPFAAALALVVYGFGPLDLEWSRLPTLHHLPVGIGLLLMWASFVAFSKKTWGGFFAIALLITSTKFVYPSAKLLALGPCLGMCGAIVWDRREWFGHKRKFGLILLGGALFIAIRSMLYMLWHQRWEIVTPVPMIQPAQGSTSLIDTLGVLAWEAFGFLYEIFYKPFSPTHWTVHATIEPLRSLPSICVVFATLAIVRLLFLVRNRYALIFLGLLIGGLIPGVVTGLAERRAAFSLILITLLAVVELAWFIDTVVAVKLPRLATTLKGGVLVVIGGTLFSLQTTGYFSRVHAKTTQALYSEIVRPLVRPDTVVVYLAEERRCEFFYGIYDQLVQGNGQIGFATASESGNTAQDLIHDPQAMLESWYYDLTDLESQKQSLKTRASWPRALYVFQDIPARDEWKAALQARYPAGQGNIYQLSDFYHQKLYVFDTSPAR